MGLSHKIRDKLTDFWYQVTDVIIQNLTFITGWAVATIFTPIRLFLVWRMAEVAWLIVPYRMVGVRYRKVKALPFGSFLLKEIIGFDNKGFFLCFKTPASSIERKFVGQEQVLGAFWFTLVYPLCTWIPGWMGLALFAQRKAVLVYQASMLN